MNYKVLIKVFKLATYMSWVGLFMSIFIEGEVFAKMGIILSSIVSPLSLNMFKELDSCKNVKKHKKI